MALIRIRSRFLSSMPTISLEDHTFYAETSLPVATMLLFTFIRHITIDRRRQYVEVHTRRCWFFTTERFIPFRHIKSISYDYKEALGLYDKYRLGLVLNNPDGEHIDLFNVVGDNGIIGALIEREIEGSPVDIQGDQQKRSLELAEFLSEFIGVPLGERY